MAERFVISAAYGRCIEGMRRDEAALSRLLSSPSIGAQDGNPQVLALVEARCQWADLMRSVPMFVEAAHA